MLSPARTIHYEVKYFLKIKKGGAVLPDVHFILFLNLHAQDVPIACSMPVSVLLT
jgi:hypothetical protein